MRDFDMIVVGAGYGGVTVAALAAKAGQRVLLVDKNKQAGGKAMTIHGEGYHYEMWPVFGTPHNNSRFHELRSELGIAEKDAPLIGPIPQGGGGYKGPDGEWRSQAGSTDQSGDAMGVNHMKELYGATDADLAQMGKLFGDIMGIADDEIDLKTGDAQIVLKSNGDIMIQGGKINIKGSGDIIIKGSSIKEN